MKIFLDVIPDICIEKVESVSTGDTSCQGVKYENNQPQTIFRQRTALKRIGTPLKNNRGYVCHLCGEKRRNRSQLYSHYSVAHYKEELMSLIDRKTLLCQFCGLQRNNIKQLIPHFGSVHDKVEDYLPPQFHHPTSRDVRKNSVKTSKDKENYCDIRNIFDSDDFENSDGSDDSDDSDYVVADPPRKYFTRRSAKGSERQNGDE